MVYTPIGAYDKNKAGHPESYYEQRHAFIDYRGFLKISPLSYWGYAVTVITASHNIDKGSFSPTMVLKHVTVDDYAWIATRAILYNCHIEHHAIVSIGAVVNNMIVQPYHVVAGNPAVVIAIWNGTRWIRPEPIEAHDV